GGRAARVTGHPFEGSRPQTRMDTRASSLEWGNPFESGAEVGALEIGDALAYPARDLARATLGEVDEDERLRRGDHDVVVGLAIGGELVRDARATDSCDAAEHLDLVVEHRRREILDRVRTHDELRSVLVPAEQVEPAEVLDPGQVEVRVVAAVVDDSLR